MRLLVNDKPSALAPVTIVVAPFQPIPNVPPGYYEVSRWTDGTGTTTLRCWPQDHDTRIPLDPPRPSIERATDRLAHDLDKIYDVLP